MVVLIDGGVILLHSVFIIWIDTWKNNFNKFAPKERERGGGRGGKEGEKDGVKDREREGKGEGRGGRGGRWGREGDGGAKNFLFTRILHEMY